MACSTMSEVRGIASAFVGRFRVSSVRAASCRRRSQEVGAVSAMTLRSAETLELFAFPKLALVHESRRLARDDGCEASNRRNIIFKATISSSLNALASPAG
jgi:hypothetical protein